MKFDPIILSADKRLEAFSLLGGMIEVLSSSSNGDENNITLQSSTAPGFGPPPHSHPWSESFYVISGSVTFMLNGDECECKAGSMVYVPSGNIHAFSSGANGVEMVEFTGNDSRAIPLFKNLSQQIRSLPPDMDLVSKIFAENGVSLHL